MTYNNIDYTFTLNYNEELANYIDDLFTQDKADKLPRETRLQASDRLIEAYVLRTGIRPPSAQLGRLATLILRDELADPNPHKMKHEDTPILSNGQAQRRAETERPFGDSDVTHDRYVGRRKTSFVSDDGDVIELKTRIYIRN